MAANFVPRLEAQPQRIGKVRLRFVLASALPGKRRVSARQEAGWVRTTHIEQPEYHLS